ncbi:MAG: hypothetical protein FWH11_14585 [Micrococcales bacterium]|nr:hypothetical protein [Micrococcales bacterium]
MRRSALILLPVAALALAAGCGGNSKACPVGSWKADNDQMLESMGMTEDDEFDTDVQGSLRLSLSAGGDFDWRWDLVVHLSDETEEAEVAIDGTLKGTWSGPDDDLELAITDADGTVEMTVDGKQIRSTDIGDSFEDADGDIKPMKATCSGSTMTLTIDEDGEPVTLTRQ